MGISDARGLPDQYAIGLGIVLTIVGIWGLFVEEAILGLLGMNPLHASSTSCTVSPGSSRASATVASSS